MVHTCREYSATANEIQSIHVPADLVKRDTTFFLSTQSVPQYDDTYDGYTLIIPSKLVHSWLVDFSFCFFLRDNHVI